MKFVFSSKKLIFYSHYRLKKFCLIITTCRAQLPSLSKLFFCLVLLENF
ncbi:hypothetical protein A1OE_1251 [Candidatus Endolissoclinum faulkneri L2]|uniref:Uncharacterized protein n=1 Tax=Candidatus Endolissoclinum faulkneri L2 TaxID=1193729 RepID=K7YIJ2_9PROT|nr:hypothetical protein A1OE_1251 [Candidatus Endolissoclinum faulkneri L2]